MVLRFFVGICAEEIVLELIEEPGSLRLCSEDLECMVVCEDEGLDRAGYLDKGFGTAT